MSGYTPLFSSILTSSVWVEDDATRITWITLLALADQDGKVEGSIPGLAQVAHVPVDACEAAIEKLKAPDRYSRTKEFDGRRIREIDGGWLVLNHSKFRERAKSRAEYYRKWRDDKKEKTPHTPKEKQTNSNSNSETPAQQPNSCATVAQEAFNEFWEAYPKKVGRADVRKWFFSHSLSNEKLSRMLGKIDQLRTSEEWLREGGRFVPHPIKWLEREGWDDEQAPTTAAEGCVICGNVGGKYQADGHGGKKYLCEECRTAFGPSNWGLLSVQQIKEQMDARRQKGSPHL